MRETPAILTIGHSTRPWPRFLELLLPAGVTAIGDVRAAPFSRYVPHFNRDALKPQLRQAGIAYVFLGVELGGRSHMMAPAQRAEAELCGLRRVVQGSEMYRITLMCAEHDPIDCHRLMLGSGLAKLEAEVGHILRDGVIEPYGRTLARLQSKRPGEIPDLCALPPREPSLPALFREKLS